MVRLRNKGPSPILRTWAPEKILILFLLQSVTPLNEPGHKKDNLSPYKLPPSQLSKGLFKKKDHIPGTPEENVASVLVPWEAPFTNNSKVVPTADSVIVSVTCKAGTVKGAPIVAIAPFKLLFTDIVVVLSITA